MVSKCLVYETHHPVSAAISKLNFLLVVYGVNSPQHVRDSLAVRMVEHKLSYLLAYLLTLYDIQHCICFANRHPGKRIEEQTRSPSVTLSFSLITIIIIIVVVVMIAVVVVVSASIIISCWRPGPEDRPCRLQTGGIRVYVNGLHVDDAANYRPPT